MVTNADNTGLIGDAGAAANALTAGLPANFFVANPDYLGGAEVDRATAATRSITRMQLELRKRLSQGFSVPGQLRARPGGLLGALLAACTATDSRSVRAPKAA